jgi:hypothetical protein
MGSISNDDNIEEVRLNKKSSDKTPNQSYPRGG